MDSFFNNIFSFPTAIFSTLLLIVVGFWLIALLGMLSIDSLDIQTNLDANTDPGMAAGLLIKLGLHQMPLSIVISIFALFAWLISYYAVYLEPDSLNQNATVIDYLINSVIVIITVGGALFATVWCCRPLNKFFAKLNQSSDFNSLLGTTCIIRTSRVDSDFGEAQCQLNDASLILKVRSTEADKFQRGDKAVLIDYDPVTNSYFIVTEQEFNH